MRTPSLLLVLVCFAIIVGCAHQKPAAAPVAKTKENPVIVRLVGQNQTVVVRATGHGPLYTITDRTGRTLVANATLDELRTNHPDLYRQIEPAVADESATATSATGKRSTSSNGTGIAIDAAR